MELDTDYTVSQEQLDELENMDVDSILASMEKMDVIEEAISDSTVSTMVVDAALESLMGVVADIRASGGICRNDITVLKDLTSSMEGVGDFLDTLPTSSFTEVPTLVNFKVTTEGFVGDIVETIKRIIRDIIAWVKSKFKALKSMLTGSSTNIAKADVVVKKTVVEKKNSSVMNGEQVKKAFVEEMEQPPEKRKAIVSTAPATTDMLTALAELRRSIERDTERQLQWRERD